MEEMRLQKYLARAGTASRRKAEELIRQGRVEVNGSCITDMGIKVSREDRVLVDGKPVEPEENKIYIVLNKPRGYVTTVKDQFGRASVLDLVQNIKERIYPVGRLDYDTSGLLILTNDGDLTHRLTHPSHELNKVYTAEISGVPDSSDIDSFKKGIKIEDYITSPALIRMLEKKDKTSIVEIIIHEGRNRQVRKMCDAIGHPVIRLTRTAIGSLILGNLAEGKWRYLNDEEIRILKGKV